MLEILIMNIDYKTIRKDLVKRRERLITEIKSRTGEADRYKRLNPDHADLAQIYVVEERDAALDAQNEENLKKINSAIQRLENGNYGECQRCGNSISVARLEAIPYTELCIDCQRKEELKSNF
jgi:DnaK suppressor protein